MSALVEAEAKAACDPCEAPGAKIPRGRRPREPDGDELFLPACVRKRRRQDPDHWANVATGWRPSSRNEKLPVVSPLPLPAEASAAGLAPDDEAHIFLQVYQRKLDRQIAGRRVCEAKRLARIEARRAREAAADSKPPADVGAEPGAIVAASSQPIEDAQEVVGQDAQEVVARDIESALADSDAEDIPAAGSRGTPSCDVRSAEILSPSEATAKRAILWSSHPILKVLKDQQQEQDVRFMQKVAKRKQAAAAARDLGLREQYCIRGVRDAPGRSASSTDGAHKAQEDVRDDVFDFWGAPACAGSSRVVAASAEARLFPLQAARLEGEAKATTAGSSAAAAVAQRTGPAQARIQALQAAAKQREARAAIAAAEREEAVEARKHERARSAAAEMHSLFAML